MSRSDKYSDGVKANIDKVNSVKLARRKRKKKTAWQRDKAKSKSE